MLVMIVGDSRSLRLPVDGTVHALSHTELPYNTPPSSTSATKTIVNSYHTPLTQSRRRARSTKPMTCLT